MMQQALQAGDDFGRPGKCDVRFQPMQRQV